MDGTIRSTRLLLAFFLTTTVVTPSTLPSVVQSNTTESAVTAYEETKDNLTEQISMTYPDDYEYLGHDVEYINNLLKVHFGIYRYGIGTVIIVGVISNVMCVVVLQSNHFR